MATLHVVFVVFPGAEALDLTGPLEVFDLATRLGRSSDARNAPRYRTTIAARTAGPLRLSSGLDILVPHALADVQETIDTLIVVGGLGTWGAMADDDLLDALRPAAARARRIASVCSGAFLLASLGLLDGKRATTHWVVCKHLQSMFPAVAVHEDPIYVRDGNVWTSAGVSSGIDMSLALVAEDFGRAAALETARWLVLFLKRPGGQSQFSAQLAMQLAEREPLHDLCAWIAEHPDADLSVPALARRVGMSVRNFTRTFRHDLGVTPRVYVERVRIDAARRALEEGSSRIEAIARRVGFGTVESMERSFRRVLGVSPLAYRSRFHLPAS